MIDQLEKHIERVKAFESKDSGAIEAFRIEFLGKNGWKRSRQLATNKLLFYVLVLGSLFADL